MKIEVNKNDAIGSAIRYKRSRGGFFGRSGRKIYIEPSVLAYLEELIDYDQVQVLKEVEALASIPSPQDGWVHKLRPNFFKAKSGQSNYILNYELTSESAIISSIRLNLDALGAKFKTEKERSCLYSVEREGQSRRFSEAMSLNDVSDYRSSWKAPVPQTKVVTSHAAVNGMLNELTKASWLMGAHLDAAYPEDRPNQYTLLHNPSKGGLPDLYECATDNGLGGVTANAKILASALKDIQTRRQPTKWVVHSQGGIIFKQAIKYHLKRYPAMPLSKNTVVFHAGGNNKSETNKLLARVGIKKIAPDRDNPFDLVPNLGGRNNLSLGGVKRSLSFLPKVFGKTKSGSTVESPHTLPYFSLESYHRFLTLAGDNQSAAKVRKYMGTLK